MNAAGGCLKHVHIQHLCDFQQSLIYQGVVCASVNHPLLILQERRVNGRLRGQLWFAACCSVPRCCATASARVVMCGACRALPFSDELLDGFPMMLPQFLQGI